jgi:hypothetical protein
MPGKLGYTPAANCARGWRGWQSSCGAGVFHSIILRKRVIGISCWEKVQRNRAPQLAAPTGRPKNDERNVSHPDCTREFTEGRSAVDLELSGGTVAGALSALWTACPGARDRVVNQQGQVRQHNVFVGNENIRYMGGLAHAYPIAP